uniref:Tripartite motif containing 42 n=1 Tax=Sphenodon punctatus TaxID=8508 RepID=A0A8D0HTG7_SPHPU
MLPCNHCICEKCIKKSRAQTEVTEDFFIITCPVCIRAHCLPYSDNIHLRMNYLRAKLSKKYMQRHGFLRWRFDKSQAPVYCQACTEKIKKATKRCLTCRMNFCNNCLRLYHSNVAAQDHIFTDYCKGALHDGHETADLPAACSVESAALFTAIAKFKKVRFGVDNDLMEVLVLRNNFKTYKEGKRKDIRYGFLKLRTILREQEREMMELLENIELEKQQGLLEYVDYTSSRISDMDSLIQYSKEALKEDRQIAFLQSANSLVKEVDEAIASIYQPSPQLREDPIQTLKLNFEELSNSLQDLFSSAPRMKPATDKVHKNPYPCNSNIMIPKHVSSTHVYKQSKKTQSQSLTSLNLLYEVNVTKSENSGKPRSTPPASPLKERNGMYAFWDASSEVPGNERNSQSLGEIHNQVSSEEDSAMVPGIVVIYQILVYPTASKIYWTCPTEDVVSFDIDYYEVVDISPDNVVRTQLAGILQWIKHQNLEIHHLNPNTEYLFKVRAFNSNGPGQWSEICKVVTPDGHGKVKGRWGLLRHIQSALQRKH